MTPPKKHRNKKKSNTNKSLWLYGKHSCLAALQNPKRTPLQILATRNTKASLNGQALPIPITETTPKEIESIVGQETVHQGIALETTPLPTLDIYDFFQTLPQNQQHSTLVILDQITDPHNVGAILRNCAAFDVDAIFTTKHHAPTENAIIAKSACGALESTPIITVTNINATLKTLKEEGYWIIGLDGYATDSLNTIKTPEKRALILGAEGKGIRRLTKENCDILINLPMNNQRMESLNVSNATAIALFTLWNQKQ